MELKEISRLFSLDFSAVTVLNNSHSSHSVDVTFTELHNAGELINAHDPWLLWEVLDHKLPILFVFLTKLHNLYQKIDFLQVLSLCYLSERSECRLVNHTVVA